MNVRDLVRRSRERTAEKGVLVLGKITHPHGPWLVFRNLWSELDPELAQVGGQLGGRLESDRGHTQALGRFHVSVYVIDVNRFSGFCPAAAESLAIDQRVRLAGAYGTRIGARRKDT